LTNNQTATVMGMMVGAATTICMAAIADRCKVVAVVLAAAVTITRLRTTTATTPKTPDLFGSNPF
jgi:hypothetical protein